MSQPSPAQGSARTCPVWQASQPGREKKLSGEEARETTRRGKRRRCSQGVAVGCRQHVKTETETYRHHAENSEARQAGGCATGASAPDTAM